MKLKKMFTVIAILMIVFMSGCKKEDQPKVRPTVTSTMPVSNAVNTAINSTISANFSHAMDPSSITVLSFTLQHGADNVSGAVETVDTTATFTPAANLAPNTIYTATITTDAKDVAGESLLIAYIWNFTTGAIPDVTPPTVTLTDPLNNATGVAVNKLIVTTFSEAMDPATITSLTYTLKQGSASVSGAVSYTASKATFTPAANLEYDKIYTGTITTSVKDLAGNALGSSYSFSFTTVLPPDIIPPTVNSTDPLNNAIDIAANKVVALTFSEAMDPLTINSTTFTLMQGTTAVSGVVAYSGTTATFTPANVLATGTVYTATITTGAKDLAGNALAANTEWSFTTTNATSNPGAVNLGTAGNYVIFSNTAIANPNSNSVITGNIGAGPGVTSTAITGFSLILPAGGAFSTSAQVVGGGQVYAFDYAVPTPTDVNTASNDMLTAYNDAAGRAPSYTELYAGDISGKTLTPGVYKWSNSVVVNSDVTLQGSSTDIWIFEISGDLNIAAGGTIPSGIKVVLSGGALASNIFWQVGGPTGATLGTYSTFNGIILSAKQIILTTGAVMNGRALAQTAVSLDANAVTHP